MLLTEPSTFLNRGVVHQVHYEAIASGFAHGFFLFRRVRLVALQLHLLLIVVGLSFAGAIEQIICNGVVSDGFLAAALIWGVGIVVDCLWIAARLLDFFLLFWSILFINCYLAFLVITIQIQWLYIGWERAWQNCWPAWWLQAYLDRRRWNDLLRQKLLFDDTFVEFAAILRICELNIVQHQLLVERAKRGGFRVLLLLLNALDGLELLLGRRRLALRLE